MSCEEAVGILQKYINEEKDEQETPLIIKKYQGILKILQTKDKSTLKGNPEKDWVHVVIIGKGESECRQFVKRFGGESVEKDIFKRDSGGENQLMRAICFTMNAEHPKKISTYEDGRPINLYVIHNLEALACFEAFQDSSEKFIVVMLADFAQPWILMSELVKSCTVVDSMFSSFERKIVKVVLGVNESLFDEAVYEHYRNSWNEMAFDLNFAIDFLNLRLREFCWKHGLHLKLMNHFEGLEPGKLQERLVEIMDEESKDSLESFKRRLLEKYENKYQDKFGSNYENIFPTIDDDDSLDIELDINLDEKSTLKEHPDAPLQSWHDFLNGLAKELLQTS